MSNFIVIQKLSVYSTAKFSNFLVLPDGIKCNMKQRSWFKVMGSVLARYHACALRCPKLEHNLYAVFFPVLPRPVSTEIPIKTFSVP